jgi:hypothetical protein
MIGAFGDSDNALMLRLGGIVILWSHLENWLGELLSYLLGANPALMHVVIDNVSSSTVTDWIRTLLQAPNVPIPASAELNALLTEIDNLRAERNALVHGKWMFEDEVALVQTIKWSRAEVVNQTVVTKLDLEQLSASIGEALDAFRELGIRYRFPTAHRGS